MTFGDLKSLSRAYLPGAKVNTISNTRRNLILNEGAVDVAALSKCLSTSGKFTVTAEKADYLTYTVLTRFLLPHKSGLYWYDGTTWRQLDPVTQKYMDERHTNWRDEDSDSPERYFIEGDILTLHPKPNTTLAEGAQMYFFAAPERMTDNAHYPFGHDTEIVRLSILSEAILKYWKWKGMGILGKSTQDEMGAAEKAYKTEVYEKVELLRRRPDIQGSRYTKYRGRTHIIR